MIKVISILTLFFFLYSCGAPSEKKENDTELLAEQKDQIAIEGEQNNKLLMTSSGSMEPSLDIKLNGCDFTIVLNNSGDTTHWSTSDNKFETPEGFKVGTNWKELPIELQKSINQMPGWGYFIRLNSNWQLGFCQGESCTDSEPKNISNVKWIFKRND